MFEKARKYSKCILCGGTNLSREHLFGEGLFARLREHLPWLMSKPSVRNPNAINDGDALMGITMKCLCVECNGRLGRNIQAVYPVLMALIEGSAKEVTSDDRMHLVRYFQRIGILGDVATSNEDLDPGYVLTRNFEINKKWRQFPAIFTPAQRLAWRDGVPGCIRPRVWIGHYRGPLGIDPQVFTNGSGVIAGKMGSENQVEESVLLMAEKRMHIAVGDLAVSIGMGGLPPSDRVPNEAFMRLDSSTQPVIWPARRLVNERDFFNLLTQDHDIARSSALAAVPGLTANIVEQMIQSAGPFQERLRAHRARIALLHGLSDDV